MTKELNRFDDFVVLGSSGRKLDIDILMNSLAAASDLSTYKLVDYALSLVSTREGVDRIKEYLFNGSQVQRNYAALYFKRRCLVDILNDAYVMGKIDREQAYLE